MDLKKNTQRRFAAIIMVVMLLFPVAAQAQNGYIFRGEGTVTIQDVRVGLWADGKDYLAKITITPTQAEIDRLLTYGSHVDFEISFVGLEPIGWETDFAIAASDHVRYSGASVSSGKNPVFTARGFNIELRWEADKSITIIASLSGYQPTGDTWPGVSVDLVSTSYRFADGVCQVVYERNMDGETKRYCMEASNRSTLVNRYGDTRFPF